MLKLNSKEHVVWLFNPKHGYRLFDRRWPVNRAAIFRGGDAWIVNPQEWTVAPVNIAEITSKYGFKLAKGDDASPTQYELTYATKMDELHLQSKECAHVRHLEKYGYSVSETTVIRHKGEHRAARCWACKGPLDSDDEMACVSCKWLLCDCGACGCGYSRQKQS